MDRRYLTLELRSAPYAASATYIAPNILVTARHVFDKISGLPSEIKGSNKPRNPYDEPLNIYSTQHRVIDMPEPLLAIQQFDDGTEVTWSVLKVRHVLDTDLSVLFAAPDNSVVFPPDITTIDLHPPTLNSTITACGWNGGYKENEGQMNRYRDRYSRTVLNAPCVEGSAVVSPGMSGGPAFSTLHDGIFGMNSKSMDYTSIHSLLWPLFDVDFANEIIEETNFYELHESGKVEVIGIEHLEIYNGQRIWNWGANCSNCNREEQIAIYSAAKALGD